MILAMDVGNSNVVIGGITDKKISFVSRMATNHSCTEDEYAIVLKDILALYEINVNEFNGSIVSSVVPPITSILANAITKAIGVKPIIVGPGVKTGLNIQTDTPTQVGADIIMNNVAAKHLYDGSVIVIDMGTATTISVTDQNKNFRGCAIFPGISVSLNALSKNTAQLQAISLESPKKVVGTNTIESMKSGIVYGNACMIDGMIEKFNSELKLVNYTVVATGGHAKYIVPYCKNKIIYNPDLLLKGLELTYRGNK